MGPVELLVVLMIFALPIFVIGGGVYLVFKLLRRRYGNS